MTGRAEALLSGPPIGLPDTRKQKCREHGMWRGILRPLPGRQARVPVFPATGRVYGGWEEGAMLGDSGLQMRPGAFAGSVTALRTAKRAAAYRA